MTCYQRRLRSLTGANKLIGKAEGAFDGHAHVFRRDLPMIENRRYTPEYDASLDKYAALLVENHLNGGLLVQPSFLGSDNSFLLESLRYAKKQYPDLTFKGVAVVEPHTTLDELEQLADAGIVGLRLNLLMQEAAFVFENWHPVLHAANQLDWHIELHARGSYLPEILADLLTTNQIIVVDHFGLPEPTINNECVGYNAIVSNPPGRVLVKISAPYRVEKNLKEASLPHVMQSVFDGLFEALGPENLVWGSDWPHTQYEDKFCFKQSMEYQKL